MPEIPITVLVVDDEPHILELLRSYLEQSGMRVLVAENAARAMALQNLHQVNVALLDIRLPGQSSGHDLLKVLNEKYPDMAKILMSGQAELDDAIAGFAEQAFSFVKKPFSSLREIRLLIERAVESKRYAILNREYARRLEIANSALEEKVAARTADIQRYQRILSHLFSVTSKMGLIEPADSLLDFVCQAIVEAGAFRQAVILLSNDRFLIQNAGAWTSGEGMDGLRDSVRSVRGQPLRPYEFNRTEQRVGSAILTRLAQSPDIVAGQSGQEWQSGDQLFLPIVRHDGTVLGYLSVDSPSDGTRPQEEIIQLLDSLLDHSALHIEAQKLRDELKRKADELELRVQERTTELQQSQEKFSQLVNSTTDIVYITDEDDRLIYLNEAFTHTLGYIRENYIGRPLRKLLEELSTDNPMNRRSVQELNAGNGDHTIYHVEVVARSGDKRTLEINRTVVRQGGVYKGSQGIVRDVTEHRAMLQQLIATERLAATGRLTVGVAHEINNPLQAITSQLNAAQQRIQSRQDPQENINQIRDGIERIRQIVRSMLDLHRAPQAPRVPLILNDVVGKVIALVSRNLNEAAIDVKLDLASDLPAIQGSPQELQQVLLNLVLNAVEAMPEGGRLTVSSKHSETTVELRVQDTGLGISSEHLSQIFEPFFTYKPSGTGLGLYLSKNIVEMHQGKISVVSEKGMGTLFTVTFPLK